MSDNIKIYVKPDPISIVYTGGTAGSSGTSGTSGINTDFLTNTADIYVSTPKAISVITLTLLEFNGIVVKDSNTIYIVI